MKTIYLVIPLAPLFAAGTCPPRLRRCITATTRAPRAGEIEGVDYFFLSGDEFEQRIAAGFSPTLMSRTTTPRSR